MPALATLFRSMGDVCLGLADGIAARVLGDPEAAGALPSLLPFATDAVGDGAAPRRRADPARAHPGVTGLHGDGPTGAAARGPCRQDPDPALSQGAPAAVEAPACSLGAAPVPDTNTAPVADGGACGSGAPQAGEAPAAGGRSPGGVVSPTPLAAGAASAACSAGEGPQPPHAPPTASLHAPPGVAEEATVATGSPAAVFTSGLGGGVVVPQAPAHPSVGPCVDRAPPGPMGAGPTTHLVLVPGLGPVGPAAPSPTAPTSTGDGDPTHTGPAPDAGGGAQGCTVGTPASPQPPACLQDLLRLAAVLFHVVRKGIADRQGGLLRCVAGQPTRPYMRIELHTLTLAYA
jgi:hypothetical protein